MLYNVTIWPGCYQYQLGPNQITTSEKYEDKLLGFSLPHYFRQRLCRLYRDWVSEIRISRHQVMQCISICSSSIYNSLKLLFPDSLSTTSPASSSLEPSSSHPWLPSSSSLIFRRITILTRSVGPLTESDHLFWIVLLLLRESSIINKII